jgi:hypothetical protein
MNDDGLHPLLTLPVHEALLAARAAGTPSLECTLDLGLSTTTVRPEPQSWHWREHAYPYPETCKERTVYHWSTAGFEPVARYSNALIKLVPTTWGPPTFEIDGIKMLPTAHVSPYDDASRKVALVEPRGKLILDTCAGLGYFAAACLRSGAARVLSFEKSPDVLWLRSLNPWSPDSPWSQLERSALQLVHADITQAIADLATASIDAILHDPPRFGIAGELYSQVFYDELARVLKARGRLFHYTGTPNKLTSGRNVPREVATRLQRAGFRTEFNGDGIVATRLAAGARP